MCCLNLQIDIPDVFQIDSVIQIIDNYKISTLDPRKLLNGGLLLMFGVSSTGTHKHSTQDSFIACIAREGQAHMTSEPEVKVVIGDCSKLAAATS